MIDLLRDAGITHSFLFGCERDALAQCEYERGWMDLLALQAGESNFNDVRRAGSTDDVTPSPLRAGLHDAHVGGQRKDKAAGRRRGGGAEGSGGRRRSRRRRQRQLHWRGRGRPQQSERGRHRCRCRGIIVARGTAAEPEVGAVPTRVTRGALREHRPFVTTARVDAGRLRVSQSHLKDYRIISKTAIPIVTAAPGQSASRVIVVGFVEDRSVLRRRGKPTGRAGARRMKKSSSSAWWTSPPPSPLPGRPPLSPV